MAGRQAFRPARQWDKNFGSNWLAWTGDKVRMWGELARRVATDGPGPTFRRFRMMRELKMGNHIGTDEYGNSYYEDPGGMMGMGCPPKRWVEYAAGHGDRDAMDVPPEWHAWLHHCGSTPKYGGGNTMNYTSFQTPTYREPAHGNLSFDIDRAYRPAAHLFKGSQTTDRGVKQLVSEVKAAEASDARAAAKAAVEYDEDLENIPEELLDAIERAEDALEPEALKRARASASHGHH